ncbi:hypothetical protein ISCGN_001676 [Ixodes scapularis]
MKAELRDLKCDCSDASESEISEDMQAPRKEVQKLLKGNYEPKTENRGLTVQVEELEQCQRANKAKGVPLECDPYEIVAKIGELVGVPVTTADIDICHHVPTQKLPENKYCRSLPSAQQKKCYLREIKVKKGDHRSPCCTMGLYRPVLNEYLTRLNKQLVGACSRRAIWKV